VSSLAAAVGTELGPTGWLEVDQDRIDAFAAATGDQQWIHVDRERAHAGPFGTTIAHGFLTLALCSPLLEEVLPRDASEELTINYGVDRVRFPAPLPAGSRVRGRFAVVSAERQPKGERVSIRATVEREGCATPVCVADLVLLVVARAE
jgi:acyl dehydratase